MKQYLIYILIAFPFTIIASSIDTVPNTSNYGMVSSEWKSMDYGDPTSEISFIKPPKAISTGNASFSFPIDLPDGRIGMQPNIAIQYSSDGGSSWLGNGWDFSISSISLDTRWGVPRFDSKIETEIYLLDGEQLGPVFHREAEYDREADRTFHLRQTQYYQSIVRHGNTPKNYWWEVREADGTIHYYGGTEKNGLSNDHILQSSDGIVEWYLMESRDPNNNFISYFYQEIDGLKGKEMFPEALYYTGHESEQGLYKVEFVLQDELRSDVSISGRYGFLRSMERLLGRIVILYKDEIIRYYECTYGEGYFGKTLLDKIAAYDKGGELFYDYEFDYYNDLVMDEKLNSYSDEDVWSVQKDNLDIGSIAGNIDGFNGKPTILGSANSESQGLSTAITVGFAAPPNTKDYTVGPNGGVVNNTSEGITAFVDIDGDGLADKVWKESTGIYYRSNLFRSEGQTAFGDKVRLEGVSSFSSSSTFAWNIGAELNVPPVYAGYSHEEATSRTTTYFIDFNGDELLDIVQNGEVYFNHLENGIPQFTKFASDTPSPIYKGEGLDPDIITFDASQLAELQKQSPLHDVVRVWKARKNGTISITAPYNLIEDSSPESTNYLTKDGVRVAIQINDQEYYQEYVVADDFLVKTPALNNININEGDNIYFRVGSIDDGSYDRIEWNPIIEYIEEPFPTKHPDNYNNNIYSASNDFLLSENKALFLVADGQVQLTYDFKIPELTDSIFVTCKGAYNYTWKIPPGKELDTLFVVDTFPAISGETLKFFIDCKSNVDWASIQWMPTIEYVEFDDGSDVLNNNGEPIISECASVEMKGFFHPEYFEELVVVDSGQATIYVEIGSAIFNSSKKTLVVKYKNYPELIKHQEFLGQVVTLEMDTKVNDSIYVGVYYQDENNTYFPFIDSASIEMEGVAVPITCGIYEKVKEEQGLYGHLYRGWGQFIYDGNNGSEDNPILFSELEIDTMDAAQDTTVIDEGSGSSDIEGTGGTEDVITVMTSDPKLMAWRGSDAYAFVSADQQGSSRRGQKYIGAPAAQVGDEFTAPALITKFSSDGGFGGFGVPGTPVAGSAGYTTATSWSTLDIIDFNGDRYPDVVSETMIQFTNMRGGLSTDKYEYNWGIHEALSAAETYGIGLNPGSTSAKNSGSSAGAGSNKSTSRIRQKTRSNAGKARSSFESATEAIGISGSIAFDNDSTSHTFLDINGDALEDKIWQNGNVALNLGYDFAPIENWGFKSIRAGGAFDVGGGLGVNISNGSYLGGISVCKTTNSSKKGFIDLNGDALVDLVISTDPLIVQFNTGSAFTDPIIWMDLEGFDEGQAIGESINAGFSIPIIFFFIKIVINVQGFIGQGSATNYDTFLDLNGDGFPDYLSAQDDDANLSARYSNIGRTNLLKHIDYPLGAEVTIDYKTEGNSENMPYSKWVMSDLLIHDGVAGDGADFQQQRFEYENGFYDRHERQFLGFQEIDQFDISGNKIVRKLEQEFYHDNYYQKGLLKKATLKDGNDNVYKEIEQQYILRDVETETVLPANFINRDDIVVYPLLSSKSIKYSEGQSSLSVQQNFSFTYDLYGNLLNEIETDQYGFNKSTEYTYESLDENKIYDRIKTETISESGSILRQYDYSYDDRGNKIEINQLINSSINSIINLEYDNYGNILQIRKAENNNGERLIIDFTYDEELSQYINTETNNYGYTKSYKYDPLFGKIEYYKDENNLEWNYTYDNKGRILSELSPRALSLDYNYSKKYEYFIDANTAYAKCSHKNSVDKPDIISYQFADGIHRLIQSKLPATVFNNISNQELLIVSGTSQFDSLGRVVKQYLEISEPLSNGSTLSLDSTTVSPEIFTYDINDRLLEYVEADGAKYEYQYDISSYNNANYLRKTINNPVGLSTELIHDPRGLMKAKIEKGAPESYVTEYKHDAMQQLLEVTHPNLSKSIYKYDLRGRRISIVTPESGRTELKYDAAGNLIEKITANIRETLSQNAAIRYRYDKERLVEINYPKNFQNKVQIHYGEASSKYNRVGRIYLIEDATGGREFFYDEFGNPSKIIQTVLINRSKILTYVSAFEHDILNRVSKLYYPDGEILNYEYNNTGELYALSGFKNDVEYPYVNSIYYDLYGEINKIEYGNSIVENWSRDEKIRKKEQLLLNENERIMELEYSYDFMNNMLGQKTVGTTDPFAGQFEINREYDAFSRVISSEGMCDSEGELTEFSTTLGYENRNHLGMKIQTHEINDQTQDLTSRFIDYQYNNTDLLLRPSEVGGKTYNYDYNGNISLVSSQAVFDFDQYIYDEENRLIGSSNNGKTSLYTYDAFSRRVIKSKASFQGIFINGAPAGWLEHKDDFQIDLNPYFTAYEHEFRKHIYINNHRVTSKIGTGIFQSTIAEGPGITAGGLDYKQRIVQLEQSILEYYAEQGLPPGPPTLLAYYSQPEYNTIGFGDVEDGNPYSLAPSNWPNIAPPDKTGPPGPPVFYEFADINNENVEPGYNFTGGNITKELEQFYYHYDAENNVNLITSNNGNSRQFLLYFLGGSKWVDRFETSDKTDFGYQAVRYDEHSGLYNLGESYYDPITGLNLSLDKYEQSFGLKTLESFNDGALFYDYAQIDESIEFDPEIINSERPESITSKAAKIINVKDNRKKKTEQDRKNERRKVEVHPDISPELVEQIGDLMEALELADLQNKGGFDASGKGAYKKIQKQAIKNRKRKDKLKQRKNRNKRKVTFRVK